MMEGGRGEGIRSCDGGVSHMLLRLHILSRWESGAIEGSIGHRRIQESAIERVPGPEQAREFRSLALRVRMRKQEREKESDRKHTALRARTP